MTATYRGTKAVVPGEQPIYPSQVRTPKLPCGSSKVLSRSQGSFLYQIAKSYFIKGELEPALALFKKCVREYKNIKSMHYIGMIYFNTKAYSKALRAFSITIKYLNCIDSLSMIGFMQYVGLAVPRDVKRAIRTLVFCAANGNPMALRICQRIYFKTMSTVM